MICVEKIRNRRESGAPDKPNPESRIPNPELRRVVRNAQSGFTLIEMILATALLGVLMMMVMPVIRANIQRQRELELKNDLRNMRRAIDDYHNQCRQGLFVADNDLNKICYPPDLETLVKGVKKNDVNRTSVRFLRRIPRDPFTGELEWGLRSTEDEPDSTSWGGDNVWDVYSNAEGLSLDGKSHYNEW